MGAAQHRKFDDGVNQDIASFLLPEGYVYSAKNMLFDKLGIARKRGGITGVGATTTYNGDNIGALVDDAGSVSFYSRGKGGNVLNYINTATGAFTNMGGSNFGDLILNDGGRPFQHYATLIWPLFSSNPAAATSLWAAGGADGSVAARAFTTPATVAVTATDKQIVCAAADNPLTLMQVGQFIHIQGATTKYVGRVTRLVSTTAFEVYPTPSITQAAGTNTVVFTQLTTGPNQNGSSVGFDQVGGRIGMSFQGRVLLGYIQRYTWTGAARLEVYPRRVMFSSTLLEASTAPTVAFQGAVWLTSDGYPTNNYFDIPAQEALTAMAPTGFGDALIFSAFRTFRLTGNLSTQFGDEQSITWAVREIPNSVGCITERSLQRTPRGVIFAHDSGIYSTDGASMQPLMYRRIANLWKGLVRAGTFAIYGSALLYGNHYYICGTSGGSPWALLVNLDTLAWTTFTGKAAAPASWLINSAIQDPSNASRVWGLKWWDQNGSGPSMTGGQLLKLDDAFNPTSANRTDSDTTIVNLELITRPYTEDSPMTQKVFQGATIEYENIGGDTISVDAAFVLDAAEMPASGTTIPLTKQDTYTVTAGTNAGPIVLTIGAGHTIPQGAFVRVSGVTGLTKANGLWRVGAVTGTTITLLGSVGNAAYISGGTVQAVDSRDFSLLAAVTRPGDNPAAVVYRFSDSFMSGTKGADSFELYGITHTWEDRDLHNE